MLSRVSLLSRRHARCLWSSTKFPRFPLSAAEKELGRLKGVFWSSGESCEVEISGRVGFLGFCCRRLTDRFPFRFRRLSTEVVARGYFSCHFSCGSGSVIRKTAWNSDLQEEGRVWRSVEQIQSVSGLTPLFARVNFEGFPLEAWRSSYGGCVRRTNFVSRVADSSGNRDGSSMVSVGERRGGLFALVRRGRDIGVMVLAGRSSASGSRRWNVASLEQFRLVDGKVREARFKPY